MSNKVKELAIIGAGPAGLVAAIEAKHNGLSPVIYESEKTLGKTILRTGNGRCNFTNINPEPSKYYNDKFVKKTYSCIGNDVYIFFDKLGLSSYVDDEGRMFPYTNQAKTVQQLLQAKIKELDIKTKLNVQIKKIQIKDNFELTLDNNKKEQFNKVIVACGGQISNLNLNIKPISKVLGPIKTNNEQVKLLDGVKVHAKCSLISKNGQKEFEETGEILFRKYGVSGICIFNVSRYLKENQKIVIDLIPDFSNKKIISHLQGLFKDINKKEIKASRLFMGLLDKKITETLLEKGNIKYSEIATCVKELKTFTLHVKGIESDKLCQINRGGVPIKEINPFTMESTKHSGLYFAGECIDVDGPCGGYNLHWAWASGLLAGRQINSRKS